MEFPQYRKYKNKNTFYKIVSEREFEEISFIGAKGFVVTILADQYPEMLRIQDMISCLEGTWVIITSENYEQQKNSISHG
jgi:hypothetical protein